jgi:hypothetical protein
MGVGGIAWLNHFLVRRVLTRANNALAVVELKQ